MKTLVEARAAIESRDVSSEELVRDALQRASADRSTGIFITVLADQALAEARRVDRALAAGDAVGPLAGIPFTVKDIVHTKGVRTTSGSKIFEDFVPEADAPCVAALKSAGAVLLGKTNLHEFAFGITNNNPHFGPCRNPWDRDRIPGGSSGGSAAAVASGIGFGSIGTDTGGSIRIPASMCGIVGLKPTYGRVSRELVTPLSWSLDHVGPLARSVEDAAVLFDVLTGSDTAAGLERSVRGLKVGVHERYFFDNAPDDVEGAVRSAIGQMESLGMELVPVDIPEIDLQADCRNVIAFSEAGSFHEQRIRSRPDDYGADLRGHLRLALTIPASDYLAALRARRPIARAFRKAFADIDVLVTPTTTTAAPRLTDERLDNGEEFRTGLMRGVSPFNTTGFPAVSLPCGFTRDGRPIGLQIAASPHGEARLLRVAHAYERTEPWWRRHPPVI